jgi:single-strand DNA-binding protein
MEIFIFGGLVMSLASISIVGNLVRAPEQISFASGKVKTIMTVAINNGRKSKSAESEEKTDADFYKVEVWGKLADLTHKYLDKGNQVGVSGRLIFEKWLDKQGVNRMTPVVHASQISFPPRLKVVSDNEWQEEIVQNTISGEMSFDEDDHLPEANDVQPTSKAKKKKAV